MSAKNPILVVTMRFYRVDESPNPRSVVIPGVFYAPRLGLGVPGRRGFFMSDGFGFSGFSPVVFRQTFLFIRGAR